jgi:hypothetical protein
MADVGKALGRERNQMILAAMYVVSDGTTNLCAYEDIVVQAWRMFPQEFGLRGYVELHPDSSDLHKPLYGPLKREGYVRVHNKKFGLTDSGLAVAERLRAATEEGGGAGRVRRDQLIEIERLARKSVITLLRDNPTETLLDTDLYDFYGVTVRTKPADFAGRIATVDQAIDAALRVGDPSIDKDRLSWITLTRDALRKQHGDLITELTAARAKSKS